MATHDCTLRLDDNMKIHANKIKYYCARLCVAFVSIYIALFLAEIVLWRMEPRQHLSEMNRGLYNVKDGRPVLKPGYHERFDDGYGRGEIQVNSYGYRGHEPGPNPRSRVLLLGDSFTFGLLLDQKETIDARIEEKEPGLEVDNLGVTGYNLPEQTAALRDWKLPANQVVYLFFYNDFETPHEMTVVDGWLVLKHRPDGTPRPDEEARMKIRAAEKQNEEGRKFSPVSSMSLPRLRRVIKASLTRFKHPQSSTTSADLWPFEKDHKIMVPRSVGYTLEMRDLAIQRNMGFHVTIIPGFEEIRAGKHFPLVAEYIAGLKAAGIPVIDLFPKLSVNDYWPHDTHFNAKGAQVAADEIYKALKESGPQVR